MKKRLIIALMLCLIFTLGACNENTTSSGEDIPSSASTSVESPASSAPSSEVASQQSTPDAPSEADSEAATNETILPNVEAENTASAETDAAQDNESAADSGNGTLVVYFTMPEASGVDAVSGASRVVRDGQVVGNTQLVAQWISQGVGGDLFAVETVQTYPAEHDALVDFADEELAANVRPELSTHISNLSDYDTVFIGYPNWWADLPMPLYTFFDEYDFAGKTIIPFSTHGGSGFSGTINTIAELEPDATVEQNGLTISRNNVPNAQEDVNAWLRELGY